MYVKGECDKKEGDVLFTFKCFSQYNPTAVGYFVYRSLPSSAPVAEWKIDLLFCLAQAQTCQLLAGYSNTGRTVIVLFIQLCMNTPDLTSCQHAHLHTLMYKWLTWYWIEARTFLAASTAGTRVQTWTLHTFSHSGSHLHALTSLQCMQTHSHLSL